MGAAAESCKVYLQDLVSFRYEGHSLGNRLRGLVGPPTGAHSRSLPVGTVTILLVNGSVVTRKACDVKVVDRSYLQPGEVVGSTSHLGGQIGVVTNVTVDLDLVEHKVREEQETKIVKGVSPSRLRRVRGLSLGDYVVSGPWLGRVIEVSVDVYVLFDDGAMCKVAKAESKMLRSVATADAHYRPVMNIPFYPGQVVTGGDTGGVFKASRWLSGHWRPDRRTGTVTKVEMSGVLVYWIASAHGDQHLVQELAPPAYQNPNDLTLFCSDSDCAWGVADMCFFLATDKQDDDAGDVALAHDDNHQQEDQPSDDDYDATDDEWESPSSCSATTEAPTKKQQETSFYKKQLRKDYFDGHRRARRRGNVGRHVEPDRVPMSVFNTHSTVDVLWQDGTRQLGAPSASVVPFDILNDQEFLPGQYVVDNAFAAENVPVDASATAAAADGSRRVGFVRSLNCKDQMVHVSWFKDASSRPGQAREIDCNDTVSAYNLEREPDHCAYFGDVVVRLPPSGTPLPQGYNKKEATPDLSWVGRVVDLPHGFVQVKWGDGSTSTVLPHEIRVINEHTYEELEAEMGDWVVDDGIDLPDEPATDYTGNVPQNPTDDSNVDRDEDHADGDDPAAITTGRMSSVMWFLNGWASNVLARARGNRYLLNWSWSPLSSSELSGAAENVGAPETVPGGGDEPRNGSATEAVDAIVTSYDSSIERKEAADATANKESFCFPRFDIVRDSPLDHHYLDTADQGSCGGKKWVKIVQREWKILQENNLPDTIYVRAFEDRIDLLRAVMVGASGTPYHDGLFFFDLQLPPSYPATPPQVYYHSFGLRLNPNLYASGTVCLSLLNTFGGEGSEVWSPATSSLLQVLVSIQGLVLNNQPYYNEAGYEALIGTPEGCRNALPYNENAYLLTLRTALHLLRRPPLGFEEFVRDHFRRRGRFILRACEAYLEGCDVGTLCSDARATEKSSERPCSRGLRSALANVVPRLVAAFTEIDDYGCV